MPDRLIFVSCGQLRPEEKRLGQRIKSEIEATPGFKAYFADAVQDLSGLSAHILDALRRSSGAVIVLPFRVWITSCAIAAHYANVMSSAPTPIEGTCRGNRAKA